MTSAFNSSYGLAAGGIAGGRTQAGATGVLLSILMVLFGAGCAGGGSSLIESVHLLCVPVAVNLDRVPGPDGVSVTVFAKGTKRAKGVRLPEGVLELEMYDGLPADGSFGDAVPLRIWRFGSSELERHSGSSAFGAGYRFTLRWDEARPSRKHLTMLARFIPKHGVALKSAPGAVAMSDN